MKYTLRYTLDPEVPEVHYVQSIQSILLDKLNASCFTIGLEHLDKYGEIATPHIHIHFESEDSMGTIRTRLVRYWRSIDEPRQGNALYSLKNIDKKARDFDRFFSYPLKQNGFHFDKIMEGNLPEGFDLDKMREYAYQEWLRSIDFHKEARRMRDIKQSTYDKLHQYLDDKEVIELKDIKMAVIAYYKVNRLSANFKTMTGYVNTYRLIKGYMSDEEALSYMN